MYNSIVSRSRYKWFIFSSDSNLFNWRIIPLDIKVFINPLIESAFPMTFTYVYYIYAYALT